MRVIIGVILSLVFLVSCVRYDLPIIYSKNYDIGDVTGLNFDGYYARVDTTYGYVKGPYFLYSDGTAKLWPGSGSLATVDSFLANGQDRGRVGNYQMTGDIISIEYWSRDSGTITHASRRILQFKIENNSLIYLGALYPNGELRPAEADEVYILKFYPCSNKPNPVPNWTREKKKWNK
jgi:hypothetical protein